MLDATIRMAGYLGAVIENRDFISTKHAHRVGLLSFVLADKVKKQFPDYGIDDNMVQMISAAAVFHDIGKLKLPDRIINKPNRLTEPEYEVYQSHTYKGKKMFDDMIPSLESKEELDFFRLCGDICLYHHERYDGDGFPEKISGEDIPIAAQIVGLADAYDDAVSDRINKKALSKLEVYDRIMTGDYGVFSPKLLHIFSTCHSELEEALLNDENKKSDNNAE